MKYLEDYDSINLKIHSILMEWIISSLDNYEKRNKAAEKLLELNIPDIYKEVPSDVLYRINRGRKRGIISSYSYKYSGVKKIISWYKEIEGLIISENEIEKVPTIEKEIVICIPIFYKKSKINCGYHYEKLWKTEYEVLCKN